MSFFELVSQTREPIICLESNYLGKSNVLRYTTYLDYTYLDYYTTYLYYAILPLPGTEKKVCGGVTQLDLDALGVV